jgi:hypothetical protein
MGAMIVGGCTTSAEYVIIYPNDGGRRRLRNVRTLFTNHGIMFQLTITFNFHRHLIRDYVKLDPRN